VELKWENMRLGIEAQASWLRSGPHRLHEQAGRLISFAPPPRIYLVGCGDSHYCGLATRLAFEHWSGIPTEALEALEFSRYAAAAAPAGSWVVCVSNSGRVARTVECAVVARNQGMVPIALTFDPGSRLAQCSAATLPFGYEDVGFGPGTISYTASLVGLFVVAVRAAELAGRLDGAAAEGNVASIAAQAGTVEGAIAASEPVAQALGGEIAEGAQVHIIGAGPNYGTALFGMAKLIEAAALPAVGQELEEWAHEQYFCTTRGTTTVVLAPPGAATDRAREQLAAVRDVDGTAVVVCDADDGTTARAADHVLPVPAVEDEKLTPLSYCIPLELLAYHYATQKGKTMLGFDDARRMEVNFRQIFDSQVRSS
jgi:glucosamine 6-phosphate synthetase-like amidotransferase/phosphosugar isomerase protein